MPACSCCSATSSTDCMSEQVGPRLVWVRHYLSTALSRNSTAGQLSVCQTGSMSAFRLNTTASACSTKPPADPLHAVPFRKAKRCTSVSTPERALLEVLSEVGVRHTGARELCGSTCQLCAPMYYANCCSVAPASKPCACAFNSDANSPALGHQLDPAQLPTGSDRFLVSRSGDGLLVLKP